MAVDRIRIAAFNDLPATAAREALDPACTCSAWQRVLVASRPFVSIGELAATSDGVLTALGWADVEQVLATEPEAKSPLVAGSEEAVTYEARFGVPFLIDPIGKTAEQVRAALAERLGNDDETEQRTVRRELAAIVRTRLATGFA